MRVEEIEQALRSLAESVTDSCEIYIVGGAAMVLRFGARVNTDDVDAEFREQQIGGAARAVAEEQGLPEDWLNTNATMYFPIEKNPEWEVLWVMGPLTVYVATARTLLAMKLRAGRVIRDTPDIEFLLDHLSISSFDDGVAIFSEFYPNDALSPRAKEILQEALDRKAGLNGTSVEDESRISSPREPDLEHVSNSVRGYWLIVDTDPLRHIVSALTDIESARTKCGKVLDIARAQMGTGRPTAADNWCAVCLET